MSWRLKVRHVTGYAYDKEVTASYNEARVTPQTTVGQTVLDSRVTIDPPSPQQRYWDYWGTHVTAFDVAVPHRALQVVGTSLVDTADATDPPTDVPAWADLTGPGVRDDKVEQLQPSPRTTADPELLAAAEAVAGLAPLDTALAVFGTVHERVAYRPGATGVQTGAAEAWRLGEGVCQDIAHVTLALLRHVGLPARYVSGYLAPRKNAEIGETTTGESHAWVEVWLGEWWGYDPTNLAPVGERHVVVARGREYGDVPPLKGIYSGGGSQALGVSVEVTRLA